MPSARSATSAARSESTARSRETRRAAPKPRRVMLGASVSRARWERLGRVALLVVLFAVLVVYGEHALSYLSTRDVNERQQAAVRRLERQHASLLARKQSLSDPATIVQRARALGMTRAGEQPYAITGQSSR